MADDVIRVSVRVEYKYQMDSLFGPVTVETRSLVDRTGHELSSNEVRQLFGDIRVVGVRVMKRFGENSGEGFVAPNVLPDMGAITDISEDTVFVNDIAVPRERFLDYYQLD